MKRRTFVQSTLLAACGSAFGTAGKALYKHPVATSGVTSGPKMPVSIYNNWSSYDELSDNIPLTEELAMRELGEVIRLKKSGVQFDYYVMDAFWFDKMGGYRTWHKQHWPNGPDAWLDACLQNNIKPGMWFSTNLIATHSGRFLEVIPEWQDSLATDPNIMCLFSGGYLRHLGETLQIWYNKGVRLFKFDFAYFQAATETARAVHTPEEIVEMNKLAMMDMLKQFRARNSDVLITGYNGFGGEMDNTVGIFKKTIDPRWLDVFDTIYSGDPRFADVPTMNIWRSQDIYSDHMVRQYEFNGMPLRRIDSCAFMTGKTGTCYYRGHNAWKGMLVLELARGGWVNVYHGNMELLDAADAAWFAKCQTMFMKLQKYGWWQTFGAIPGTAQPYGFKAEGINGCVITVVNPSQAVQTITLPIDSFATSALMYADGGFKPVLAGKTITLGPEQMAVAGFDEYALPKYDLGVDETVQIPPSINKLDVDFKPTGSNTIEGHLRYTSGRRLRIVMQQFDEWGYAYRSWGGAPPDGKKMTEYLQIEVRQNDKVIPLKVEYDKMIWSGLSWGAAELDVKDIDTAKPLAIKCLSTETYKLTLKADVYAEG